MKVVHNIIKEGTDKAQAEAFESNDELDKAARTYERLLKSNRFDEHLYRRLMIIYRKQKDFPKELKIIRAGIKAFEELYQPGKELRGNKKIASLSRALLKSTGLSDKKGKPLYQKEPIGSWTRRLNIVEKKLGKGK